jgi:hypothetical protein
MIEQPETLFIGSKTFSKIEMQFSGSKAKVAVVFDEKNATLSAQENELLFKILASVKVLEGEVAVIHAESAQPSIAAIKSIVEAQYVLVFSANSKVLSENLLIPVYEVLDIDEIKILRAAPISKIMTNAEHKSALWKNLKLMFGL